MTARALADRIQQRGMPALAWSPHAHERVREMMSQGMTVDELNAVAREPEVIRISPKYTRVNIDGGRVTLALDVIESGAVAVVTVLWKSDQLWIQAAKTHEAPGRSLRRSMSAAANRGIRRVLAAA